MADNTYWDSFDCQIQCEEVYTEDPSLDPANFGSKEFTESIDDYFTSIQIN